LYTTEKWTALVLATLLLGGGSSGFCRADDVRPPRVKAVIPFTEGPDGEIYVRASLNDKTTATFLVDTGVDSDYLSSTVADKLGLRTIPATHGGKPLFLAGKALQGVIVPDVVVGQARYPGIAFALLSPGQLPDAPDGRGNIDGILGAPALMPFAVMLDYAHDRMTVWSPSSLTADDMAQEGFHALYAVPITPSPTDENQWTAHVMFTQGTKKAEQDLTVDTGANRTTVPPGVARQLNIKKDGEGQATLFLNKPITVDYGRIAQMQIGDLTLRNATVYYAEQDLLEYPVSLSMNLFRGYIVLLDFGRHKMYVGTLSAPPTGPP
jgi:predicted aspartyl protease